MKRPPPPRTLTIDQVAALTALSKRTVRYYIQLGLVDGPDGETRAARYGPDHVERLLAIRKWSEAGVALERIAEIVNGAPPPVAARPPAPGTIAAKSHVTVADGIELVVDPARAALSPAQARGLYEGVLALWQDLTKEQR